MSEFHGLRISYKNGPGVGDDWLRLEQPEWREPGAVGFSDWLAANNKSLPVGASMSYYYARLNQYWEEYISFCSADGGLEVELEVHRSRLDLGYVLRLSHGELSERFVVERERKLSETILMADSFELEHYVTGPVSAFWEGAVYDSHGAPIPAPVVGFAGGVLYWGQKVVGSLRLAYTEVHDQYVLTLSPRPVEEVDPERPESAFESTVLAFWGSEQVVSHEVDLPEIKGNCSGHGAGGSVSVSFGPGEDEDGREKCYRLHKLVDPCSGEQLDEWLEEIDCPEDDEGAEA